jgi:outer membrane protein assembly factor BamB
MKNNFTFVMLFACTLIQCSNSEDSDSPAKLSLSTSTVTVAGSANNTSSFDVVANKAWTITSSESWILVNPSTGSGNKTVSIEAEKNAAKTSRTAVLTITVTGMTPQVVTVTQDRSYEPIYSVSSPKDGFAGAILKIDPATGKTLSTIPIATDPNFEDGLAFDGTLLYYINGRTDFTGINKVIVIDPAKGLPIDTLSTVFPERMDALAINKKDLYVLDFLGKKIYRVSLESQTITATIVPAFEGTAIGGMSYGGSRGTIFVSSFTFGDASTNRIYEINASTGAVINSFAMPVSAFGVAYSEAAGVLYVSTGEPFDVQKSIYVLDPDSGAVLNKFSGSSSAMASDESSL